MFFFFFKFETRYRKSCKYMRNNSITQKGKIIQLTISKFRAQQYEDLYDQKRSESLEVKKVAHMRPWF